MINIQELQEIDKSFNEVMFKSKINNIFVMLYSCIMTRNLDRVRHFISEDLENKYDSIINKLKEDKLIQMYDELNVKDSYIKNIEINDEKIIIDVVLISRYMDYKIDEDTKKYVSGINDHRIEVRNILRFEKYRNAKDYKLVKKCPTCGASIDLNKDGKCQFCKTIFDAENYDYILVSIEQI